jgi:hypothetical protein
MLHLNVDQFTRVDEFKFCAEASTLGFPIKRSEYPAEFKLDGKTWKIAAVNTVSVIYYIKGNGTDHRVVVFND